jgi:hypothetical protein
LAHRGNVEANREISMARLVVIEPQACLRSRVRHHSFVSSGSLPFDRAQRAGLAA